MRNMLCRKACAFTGHRSMRFSFGFDEEDERCLHLKLAIAQEIRKLIESGVSLFYTGMDRGADQWAAEIVLNMKWQYPNVQLIAVLPCETQANKWSAEQRERYFDMLAMCDDVMTLRAHYTPKCMLERNRYMVDQAEYLMAVYDGNPKGDTAYTIRYAHEKNRQIIIIHPDTMEIVPQPDLEVLERRKQLRVLPEQQVEL